MKKKQATLQVGMDVTQLFCFMHGQNMQLWGKMSQNKIVLPHLPRSYQPTKAFGIGPKAHSGGPKSAEFGCIAENQSCSGGYPRLIYSLPGWTCLQILGVVKKIKVAMIFGCVSAKNTSILKISQNNYDENTLQTRTEYAVDEKKLKTKRIYLILYRYFNCDCHSVQTLF